MTNLSDIYDIFLSKISDYNLINLLPEEIDEELLGYFKSARTKFYKCKTRLDILVGEEGYFFGYEEDVYHVAFKEKIDEESGEVIRIGDTLDSIALKYSVSVDKIKEHPMNKGKFNEDDSIKFENRDSVVIFVPKAIFKVNPTYYEMEILVKLMLVEYMTPILLSRISIS